MKILILGGTGGTGLACAQEFLSQGNQVVLLGRDEQKLRSVVARHGPGNLTAVVGNVYDPASLEAPFRDADVVIQTANPGYLGIVDQLPRLTDSVLETAERTGRRVVFIEGIYTYGRNPDRPVREVDPPQPVSRKGEVKQRCADVILSPKWNRARAQIVRLPDYFGPTSQAAYLDTTLRSLVAGRWGVYLGSLAVPREFVFLPDVAKQVVTLALDDRAYGQIWNLSGQVVSGRQIVHFARGHLGRRTPVVSLGPRAIRLMGRFDRFFAELAEMTYLLEDPVILDGSKYVQTYGKPVRTGIDQALALTLDAWGSP